MASNVELAMANSEGTLGLKRLETLILFQLKNLRSILQHLSTRRLVAVCHPRIL